MSSGIIEKSFFGVTGEGIPVYQYTLTNDNGLMAKVIPPSEKVGLLLACVSLSLWARSAHSLIRSFAHPTHQPR